MPTAIDLEELDRIDQNLRLRLAEIDRSMDGTAAAEAAALPGPKIFDSLAMALLLWQNRFAEMAHRVKAAEAALHADEALSRDLLKNCSELKARAAEVPEWSPKL